MKKYSYEYVRIDTNVKFFAAVSKTDSHIQVIDDYAQKGWRFAGIVPAVQTSEGRIMSFDLIFEKEIE